MYRAGLNKVTDCINSLLVPFFLRGLGGSIAVWLLNSTFIETPGFFKQEEILKCEFLHQPYAMCTQE